jgi:hypothetical protein
VETAAPGDGTRRINTPDPPGEPVLVYAAPPPPEPVPVTPAVDKILKL